MPQHQKQVAARGNSKAEFCSCRAISSGATKGTCHASKSKMQALLGLGIQWRDKVGLSRQACWRDRSLLPRHCVPKPSRDCIFDLVAWQIALVAPLRMARQSTFVAPPGMARQAHNSASQLCCCECGRHCCECCRGDDELRKFPANRISAAGSNCEYVRKLKSDKNYCETVYLFLIQIL